MTQPPDRQKTPPKCQRCERVAPGGLAKTYRPQAPPLDAAAAEAARRGRGKSEADRTPEERAALLWAEAHATVGSEYACATCRVLSDTDYLLGSGS